MNENNSYGDIHIPRCQMSSFGQPPLEATWSFQDPLPQISLSNVHVTTWTFREPFPPPRCHSRSFRELAARPLSDQNRAVRTFPAKSLKIRRNCRFVLARNFSLAGQAGHAHIRHTYILKVTEIKNSSHPYHGHALHQLI